MRLTHIHTNVTPEQVGQTYPGMAHWAGSGPKGQTCRQCIYWTGGKYRYSVGIGHMTNELKPAQCSRYAVLTGKEGPKNRLPHHARACRHFDANPKPPAICEARR